MGCRDKRGFFFNIYGVEYCAFPAPMAMVFEGYELQK
tara:strand:- start:1996 stop:2106 length:111 start_codon:yes stop_codon:yes gene_type:complete